MSSSYGGDDDDDREEKQVALHVVGERGAWFALLVADIDLHGRAWELTRRVAAQVPLATDVPTRKGLSQELATVVKDLFSNEQQQFEFLSAGKLLGSECTSLVKTLQTRRQSQKSVEQAVGPILVLPQVQNQLKRIEAQLEKMLGVYNVDRLKELALQLRLVMEHATHLSAQNVRQHYNELVQIEEGIVSKEIMITQLRVAIRTLEDTIEATRTKAALAKIQTEVYSKVCSELQEELRVIKEAIDAAGKAKQSVANRQKEAFDKLSGSLHSLYSRLDREAQRSVQSVDAKAAAESDELSRFAAQLAQQAANTKDEHRSKKGGFFIFSWGRETHVDRSKERESLLKAAEQQHSRLTRVSEEARLAKEGIIQFHENRRKAAADAVKLSKDLNESGSNAQLAQLSAFLESCKARLTELETSRTIWREKLLVAQQDQKSREDEIQSNVKEVEAKTMEYRRQLERYEQQCEKEKKSLEIGRKTLENALQPYGTQRVTNEFCGFLVDVEKLRAVRDGLTHRYGNTQKQLYEFLRFFVSAVQKLGVQQLSRAAQVLADQLEDKKEPSAPSGGVFPAATLSAPVPLGSLADVTLEMVMQFAHTLHYVGKPGRYQGFLDFIEDTALPASDLLDFLKETEETLYSSFNLSPDSLPDRLVMKKIRENFTAEKLLAYHRCALEWLYFDQGVEDLNTCIQPFVLLGDYWPHVHSEIKTNLKKELDRISREPLDLARDSTVSMIQDSLKQKQRDDS